MMRSTKILAAICFLVIGFSAGVMVTLRAVGFS